VLKEADTDRIVLFMYKGTLLRQVEYKMLVRSYKFFCFVVCFNLFYFFQCWLENLQTKVKVQLHCEIVLIKTCERGSYTYSYEYNMLKYLSLLQYPDFSTITLLKTPVGFCSLAEDLYGFSSTFGILSTAKVKRRY